MFDSEFGQTNASWQMVFSELESKAKKKRGKHRRRLLKHVKDAREAIEKLESALNFKAMEELNIPSSKLAGDLADLESQILAELMEPFGIGAGINTRARKLQMTKHIEEKRNDPNSMALHRMNMDMSVFCRNARNLSDDELEMGLHEIIEAFLADFRDRNGREFEDRETLLDQERMDNLIDFVRKTHAKIDAGEYSASGLTLSAYGENIRSQISEIPKEVSAASHEHLKKYADQIAACESDYDEEIAMNFMFELAQMATKYDLDVPTPDELESITRGFFKLIKEEGSSSEQFKEVIGMLFK